METNDILSFFDDEPSSEAVESLDDISGPLTNEYVAVLGDLHLGARGCSTVYMDHFRSFFRDTFWPEIVRRGVKDVVQLGDFFDNRKHIDVLVLDFLKREIVWPSQEHDVTWTVLVGNHDSYYKNTIGVNSVDCILSAYDDVFQTISEPMTITVADAIELCVIPWICEENRDACMEEIHRTTAKICVGHFELTGFDMYKGVPAHGGMDSKSLEKFDRVFTGHFHTPSDSGGIRYVGTPYWITKSDVPDRKHFVLLDRDTLEEETVYNTDPLYVRLRCVEDLEGHDLRGKIAIVDPGGGSQDEGERIVEEARRAGAHDVLVDNRETEEQEDDQLDMTESMRSPLQTLLDMTEDEKIQERIVSVYNESLGSSGETHA